MIAILLDYDTDSSSDIKRIRSGNYLLGTGASVASLSWESKTFPSDGAPNSICFDPVSGKLLLIGPADSGSDSESLWTSTDGDNWTLVGTLADLLGLSAADAYVALTVDNGLQADGIGGVLMLVDHASAKLSWSRSPDGGATWSAPASVGPDNFFPTSFQYGGGRWAVAGYQSIYVSDASTPTTFTESLDATGYESLFLALGFVGNAWVLLQPFDEPSTLKRCTSAVLASGSWQAGEELISSGWGNDMYEGTVSGGAVTKPFFPRPGLVRRLQRAAGGYRSWMLRLDSSVLFSDDDDGSGWDKSLADHTAGSGVGMHPFLDYRRQNFASGDDDQVADIGQDPNAKDSLLAVGWTYTQGGVTYRKGVTAYSLNGGGTWSALSQLPVSSGEWGLLFILTGSGGGGGAPGAPAPDRPARPSRDTIFFDFTPIPGVNLMRFLRDEEAWAFREAEFQPALYNQHLLEAPYVRSERRRIPGLLAEPLIPDGQLLPKPFDFTPAPEYAVGEWNVDEGITLEEAATLFRGIPSTRVVNDGTSGEWESLWIEFGAYTGEPQTLAFVVQRGSYDFCEFWFWDPGISDDVYEVRLNLRDGTSLDLYGTGVTRMIRLPTLGGTAPAWLVFITYTGTVGELISFGFMPTTREEVAGYQVVSHIGMVNGSEGVNPLSLGQVAGGLAHFPGAPALAESTYLGRLVLGLSAQGSGYFWHRGPLDGSPPYIALRCSAGTIYAEHDNGSDPPVQSAVTGLSWREGDELLYALHVFPGGAVHLVLSLEGGPAQQGPASEDAAIAASAVADAVVLIRGDAEQARCHHLRLIGLHSSHMGAVPGVALPTPVLDERRRYAIRGNGLGDLI